MTEFRVELVEKPLTIVPTDGLYRVPRPGEVAWVVAHDGFPLLLRHQILPRSKGLVIRTRCCGFLDVAGKSSSESGGPIMNSPAGIDTIASLPRPPKSTAISFWPAGYGFSAGIRAGINAEVARLLAAAVFLARPARQPYGSPPLRRSPPSRCVGVGSWFTAAAFGRRRTRRHANWPQASPHEGRAESPPPRETTARGCFAPKAAKRPRTAETSRRRPPCRHGSPQPPQAGCRSVPFAAAPRREGAAATRLPQRPWGSRAGSRPGSPPPPPRSPRPGALRRSQHRHTPCPPSSATKPPRTRNAPATAPAPGSTT